MLSIMPLKNAAHISNYYMNHDNYYLADKEGLKDESLWMGKGAELLGLSGNIEEQQFLPLLKGILPNGSQIGANKTGKDKHRPGTDITLSAPKSVSILALAGKDERLVDAHKKAVLAVVSRLEAMAAEARMTSGDDTIFEKTRNLVIASFLHNTSRELDPQLHTHLIILNMTMRNDGMWRALSSRQKKDMENLYNGFREILYDNQHYFGLVYISTLAKEVKKHGYEIDIKDRYGNFEINGVPDALIKSMSKRTEQMNDHLKDKNIIKTAKSAEVANKDSRPEKMLISTKELDARWQKDLTNNQVDLDEVINASKEQKSSPEFDSHLVSMRDKKQVVSSIANAIDHLSQFNAEMHHADIIKHAFFFSSKEFTNEDIESELQVMVNTGKLINHTDNLYTTRALLEKEDAFKKKMLQRANTSFSIKPVDKSLGSRILSHTDRVQVVNVIGNTNEADLIQDIVNKVESDKKTAYILHPLMFQKNQLNEVIGHDKSTLWKRLKGIFKGELTNTLSGFTARYEHQVEVLQKRDKKDVIVVCDSQKVAYDDLVKLNILARKANSKIILLNNEASTEGYKAGNPIRALKNGGIREHYSTAATQKYDCHIHQLSSHINDVADKYIKDVYNDEKRCLVALSKVEQKDLTNVIRYKLKKVGNLSFHEKDIQTMSSEQLSEAQRKSPKFYKEGDILITNPWTSKQKYHKVLQAKGNNVNAIDGEGIKVTFNLDNNENYIVKKAQSISAAIGDRYILDQSKIIDGRKYDKGTEFTVQSISKDNIVIKTNNSSHKITDDEMSFMPLSYSYVKRKHTLNQKYDLIQISAKASQVNRQLMGEISEYLTSEETTIVGHIDLFTNDSIKASANLASAKIKHSVNEISSGCSSYVQRDISRANETIKQDLETLYESLSIDPSKKSIEHVAKEAVSYALAKCHESNAAVIHKELMTEALIYSLGKADADDLIPILHERLKSSSLMYCNTHWINEKELNIERNILQNNKQGQGILKPVIQDKNELLSIDPKLTTGQKDAVFLALTTKDRFTTVQGLAGVGKTTMTREIKKFTDAHGINLVGIATTNRARSELGEQGIPTITVANFIISDGSYEPNTLFILDEVSMVGNHDYLAVQKKIISCNGRKINTGDRAQLQSISSGVPHELNIDTQTQKSASMIDIVRQDNNPLLKEAVYDASKGDIDKAHDKLKKIDPEKWVERDDTSYSTHSSVVEINLIDEDSGEVNLSKIYTAVATDFLSRTKECRDNTLVIAHANEDREHINLLIREGLKEKDEISRNEFETERYLTKDLKKAEKMVVSSYEKGDVIRFDKTISTVKAGDYLFVNDIDIEGKRLHCMSAEGNKYDLRLDELRNGDTFSVYKNMPGKLAIGDQIRLKRTEILKGRKANDCYSVVNIDSKHLVIEQGGVVHCLDRTKCSDKHWDYAYTNTAFTSQGATRKWVISLELSFRTKSTNWRSQYIDISRAMYQQTTYTDNHKALIERTSDNKKQVALDKKSAYLMYCDYQRKMQKEKKFNLKAKDIPQKSNSNISYQPSAEWQKGPRIEEISAHLQAHCKELCHHLLGSPNPRLSNSNNYRYGKKGSLSIQLSKGVWKDFESGESGNLFELIKTQVGMTDFPDVVQYSKDFLNITTDLPPLKPRQSINKGETAHQKKMLRKAKELYDRSKPLRGTPAEKYLKKHRGITNTKNIELRSLDKIETYHGGKRTYVPALLATIFDDKGNVSSVQFIKINPRTYSKDKRSDIPKMTNGAFKGYGCELNKKHDNGTIYVAEGVETGLSILEVKPDARVIVTFGVSNYKNLKLDKLGKDICFCLDNDGDATFKNENILSGIKAAQKHGKNVSYIRPQTQGHDLNDTLIHGGKSALSATIEHKIQADNYIEKYNHTAAKITNNKMNKGHDMALKHRQIEQEIVTSEINKIRIKQPPLPEKNISSQALQHAEREL